MAGPPVPRLLNRGAKRGITAPPPGPPRAGEGRLDGQTLSGKAPSLVAARARRLGIPCVAIAGGLAPGLDRLPEVGISAAVSLCPGPMPLAEAMARAEELLAEAAQQVLRIFLAGRGAASES